VLLIGLRRFIVLSMSVVQYVFCICRLWVTVLYVTCVFLASYSKGSASLTYISKFAGVAC
jgi:hypothetical protein